MKRVIIQLPADQAGVFKQVDFTPAQITCKSAVVPMPGTIEVGGKILADCLIAVIPENLPEGFTIIAQQAKSGEFDVPLIADVFLAHLAPIIIYGPDMAIVGTEPATLHQPHTFAGWPDITVA